MPEINDTENPCAPILKDYKDWRDIYTKDYSGGEGGGGGGGGGGSEKGEPDPSAEQCESEEKPEDCDWNDMEAEAEDGSGDPRNTKIILKGLQIISRLYAGMDISLGHDRWNVPQFCRHFVKGEAHKAIHDKLKKKEIKEATIVYDTSGSCDYWIPTFVALSKDLLDLQYHLTVMEGPNGFQYGESQLPYPVRPGSPNAENYRGSGRLIKLASKCNDYIIAATLNQAAHVIAKSNLTFVFADFDGVITWCKLAKLVPPGKVPYWVLLEERGTFSTEHITTETCPQYQFIKECSHGAGYPISRIINVAGNVKEISREFLRSVRSWKQTK